MNVGFQLLAAAMIACFLLVIATAEVMLFRISCLIAGVRRPGLGRSAGVVLVTLVAVYVAEAMLGTAVWAAYKAGDFPLWEAGLVAFFIGLPVHMIVCAAIHARMTDVRIADGLAVWFVEKVIQTIFTLLAFGLLLLIIFFVRR